MYLQVCLSEWRSWRKSIVLSGFRKPPLMIALRSPRECRSHPRTPKTLRRPYQTRREKVGLEVSHIAAGSLTFSPARGPGPPWTKKEIENLPKWFEQHQHLSSEEIEREYYRSYLKARSYVALQTRLYKEGFGELSNKRKKVSHENVISRPHSPAVTPSVAETADPVQLSLAMSFISTSFSSTLLPSLRPKAPEIEVRFDSLRSQTPRRNSSTSQGANKERERAIESGFPALDIAQPDVCKPSDADEDVSEDTNKTTVRNEESPAKASPPAHTHSSDCEPIEHRLSVKNFHGAHDSFPGKDAPRAFI